MNNKIIKTIVGLICFGFSTIAELGANPEFKPLFTENSLSEWESLGPAKWTVRNGTLITGQDGDPKRWGMLQSKKQYLDVELKLEFKIDEQASHIATLTEDHTTL